MSNRIKEIKKNAIIMDMRTYEQESVEDWVKLPKKDYVYLVNQAELREADEYYRHGEIK